MRVGWVGFAPETVKTGYEISFNHYLKYKLSSSRCRTLEKIRADIVAVEWEVEELVHDTLEVCGSTSGGHEAHRDE